MNIKFVAVDMDGTLLDSKKRLPEGLYDWVEKHKGVKLVIASGRQYYALKKDFEPVHEDLIYIAENGALVFVNDEIIFHNEIKKEDVSYCLKLLKEMPYAKPVVCGAKGAYMENPNEHDWKRCSMFCPRISKVDDIEKAIEDDIIVKIAVYFRNDDAEEYAKEFESLPSHINAVLSGVSWIDIANAGSSKGKAMRFIQDKYSVSRSECMAFGDYFNDVELLEVCEESFFMENGHPDMRKFAKHVAPSNDENGVMRVLADYEYAMNKAL